MHTNSTDNNSEIYRVISAIEDFGGACDPAFDGDLEELERQFAELRISKSRDMN